MPLSIGTGPSTSTAPGRRGVEPLARVRILPNPSLPPLPRARVRFRGWAVILRPLDRLTLYGTVSTHPFAVGVIILQLSPDLEDSKIVLRRLSFSSVSVRVEMIE